MSKTAALQKSIAKEMTDAKLMIVKERNMPSHTKEKKESSVRESLHCTEIFCEMGSETQLRKHPKRSSTPEQIKDTSVFGYDLFVKLNCDNRYQLCDCQRKRTHKCNIFFKKFKKKLK